MRAKWHGLQILARSLGLDDIVLFLGRRGQNTLPYYYSAAEVVVMPSHYESFGMVALEAMACGTPVIASRVGGLAHLVKDGETGFFVPAQDPEAWRTSCDCSLCSMTCGKRWESRRWPTLRNSAGRPSQPR